MPFPAQTHQMWRARWTWGRNIQPCRPAGPSASPPAPGRRECDPWRPPPAPLTWARRAGRPLPGEEPREAAWSTGRRWGRKAHSMTCATVPPKKHTGWHGDTLKQGNANSLHDCLLVAQQKHKIRFKLSWFLNKFQEQRFGYKYKRCV